VKIKDPTVDELAELRVRREALAKLKAVNGGRYSPPDEELLDDVVQSRASVWQRQALLSRNGKRVLNAENVQRFLEHCPAVNGVFRYDEFARRVVLVATLGDDPNISPVLGVARAIRDEDYTQVQLLAQRSGLEKISREVIVNGIQKHARYYFRFNPIRDYLEGLKPWDGKRSLLKTLFISHFGARGQAEHKGPLTARQAEYLAKVALSFFIGAVARAMDPGCKVDTLPVLEAAQGRRKSSGIGLLFEPWFSDSLPIDLGSKDALSGLAGNWGIELAELSQLKRSEIETAKQFFSRRIDKYRPAYGREEVEQPRACVFIASTNEEHYLKDTTGNRRFLPVKCGYANLKLIAMHRAEIWAEAYARYKAGESWWFDGEDAKYAGDLANERVAPDPWRSAVVAVLGLPVIQEFFSPGEVLAQMGLDVSQQTPQAAGRLAVILRELGCEKVSRHKTRGILYKRPGNITVSQ
jgi:predicted P-loop ATPase